MASLKEFTCYIVPKMNGQGDHANCTPYWKSTTYEVPKAEHVLFVNSEFGSFGNISGACTDMLLSNECLVINIDFGVFANEPLFTALSIEDSFGCGEGLRVYKQQSLLNIKALSRSIKVDWINVGEKSNFPSWSKCLILRMRP